MKHNFFLKNYANIDHMSPYINHLIDESKEINLILYNINYEYENNDLINYFKKKPNVNTKSFKNYLFKKNFLLFLIVKIFNFIKIFIFKYKYLNKLYSYLSFLNVYITDKHLILYFDNFSNNKKAINFFDYSEDKFKNIKKIKEKININKSISINVPHWVWLWKNKSRTFSDFNIKILNNENFGHIYENDFCIAENNRAEEILRFNNVHQNKIIKIGSLRFTEKWINQRDKISNYKNLGFGSNKDKILFILPKLQDNINFKEILLTINFLISDPTNSIIIQSHPQSKPFNFNFLNKNNFNKNIKTKINSGFQTKDLINWSDLVLNVNATVFFEALLRKNHLLILVIYNLTNFILTMKYLTIVKQEIIFLKNTIFSKRINFQVMRIMKFIKV
tara:strand:+ start:513 stop:1685 length:1173 start_codon:yes stop_codon:yes gene_type:complete